MNTCCTFRRIKNKSHGIRPLRGTPPPMRLNGREFSKKICRILMTDRSKQWQRSNYNDCNYHQPSLGHTALTQILKNYDYWSLTKLQNALTLVLDEL